MLDPALSEFFSALKSNWHRKKIKPSMADDKKAELIKECNELYNLKRWLPFAADNAIKRALSSHPSKFSHPDVGASMTNVKKKTYVSPVIFHGERINDGLIRTGNVSNTTLDSTGNGAEVGAVGEVGSLLSLQLSDGKRFFEHLQQSTDEAKALLVVENYTYADLRDGLLAMVKQDDKQQTSSKIKQIYFPVDDDYHLLSVLTNSGVLYKLREKIDACRFGEELALLRENKKKNRQGSNFKEIYNVATIGFGGTQPNNISTINNSNAGKAHMLMSLPPSFSNRDINFPTKDIFSQNIRYGQCRALFLKLHAIYQLDLNNRHVRAKRDTLYQDVIDYVLATLWQVRSAKNQFLSSNSELSKPQRIWLHVNDAPDDDQWLDDILRQITQFLFHGYEKVLTKKAIKLGDAEIKHMAKIANHNKELLR